MLRASWIGDGPIDNEEEVASSENISNWRLKHKNYSLFMAKITKTDTLFLTKTANIAI